NRVWRGCAWRVDIVGVLTCDRQVGRGCARPAQADFVLVCHDLPPTLVVRRLAGGCKVLADQLAGDLRYLAGVARVGGVTGRLQLTAESIAIVRALQRPGITTVAMQEVHIVVEALLVGGVTAELGPLLALHPVTVFRGLHLGRVAL